MRVALVVVIALLLQSSLATAEEEDRLDLGQEIPVGLFSNLRAVRVSVSGLPKAFYDAGITPQDFEAEIASRLRAGRVKTASGDASLDVPTVVVDITAVADCDNELYSVTFSLRERLRIERAPEISVGVDTFRVAWHSRVAREEVVQQLRSEVLEQVRVLARLYRKDLPDGG